MTTKSFISPQLNALIKSALTGNTDSQNKLGDLYRLGDDVAQNYAEALHWYQRAADAGNPEGQNNVGSIYLNGLGTEPDTVKAVEYYSLAAEQGLPIAQYNLGVRYREGEGVPINLSESAKYFELAAESGCSFAQNEFAVLLRYGIGIPKDILRATHWLIEAAKKLDVTAMGNLYDITEELKLIANAGNKEAQKYLATIKAIQSGLAANSSQLQQKHKQKQDSVKKQKVRDSNDQFELFLNNLITSKN